MNELQDFECLKCEYEKEYLHDVFSTVLDTFPNITGATVRGQIYYYELLQKIKYNLLQDIDVKTFLSNKYIDGTRSEEYDLIKQQLPAICYNARFNGYKNEKNILKITNLMFLDIDDFKSTEEAIAYKSGITAKYDWIVSCNLSLSKIGLHIVILVDTISDNDDFNRKYNYISSTYFDGMLDLKSKSLTRYTVIPYDFNIYINEFPSVLEIDNIINTSEKGISSAYNNQTSINKSDNEKSICSVYNTCTSSNTLNKEGGIFSAYGEEKIIYTAYTFPYFSPLSHLMNDAARNHGLRFRQEIDEKFFSNPDIPLYYPEGVDVMEINLFSFRNRKVKTGNRTSFLGALTIQMIYLNVESFEHIDQNLREDILKFIFHINNTICEPPLPKKEVIFSYNANWKKFNAGKIDFSRYFNKQRAFWSKNTTLKGNEKRKVTCRIKNEPIVEKSKRRLREAIETLHASGKKITQKNVAAMSGMKLPTVKKYKKEYKEYKVKLEETFMEMENNCKPTIMNNKDEHHKLKPDSIAVPVIQVTDINSKKIDIELTDLKDSEDVDYNTIVFGQDFPVTEAVKEPDLLQEQIFQVYTRIFKRLSEQIDETAEKELYSRFLTRFSQLSQDDANLLVLSPEDIKDGDIFFKQAALENKFWAICDNLTPVNI